MLDFLPLAERCAPAVHAETMRRIVRVESSFNPNAIAVTKAPSLQRQPRNRDEAIATAKSLSGRGLTYDAGLAQVNSRNFHAYGLTPETVFEPCANLRAASEILRACFLRASKRIFTLAFEYRDNHPEVVGLQRTD